MIRTFWLKALRPFLRTALNRFLVKQVVSVYWAQDFLRNRLTAHLGDITVESPELFVTVADPIQEKLRHANAFPTRALVELRDCVVDSKSGRTWVSGHLVRETLAEGLSPSLWVPRPLLGRRLQIDWAIPVVRKNWNYYHWIIEGLGPVLRAHAANRDALAILDSCPPAFVTEALDFADIAYSASRKSVRAKHLLLPAGGSAGPWPHPKDIDLLREIFLSESDNPQTSRPRKKLYVSRRFSSRPLANEALVEEELRELNFEIVRAETKSFREQVELFSSAELIVGTHGAGLTNVLFSRRGSKVVEIASPENPNYCFENLSAAVGHSFIRVFSTPLTTYDSHTLEPQQLETLLEIVR